MWEPPNWQQGLAGWWDTITREIWGTMWLAMPLSWKGNKQESSGNLPWREEEIRVGGGNTMTKETLNKPSQQHL